MSGFVLAIYFEVSTDLSGTCLKSSSDEQLLTFSNVLFYMSQALFLQQSWSTIDSSNSYCFNINRSRIAEGILIVFMVICPIILLNLLIAMMASTIERSTENAKVQSNFSRFRSTYELSHKNAVMPPPFNMVAIVLMILLTFIDYGIRWCSGGWYVYMYICIYTYIYTYIYMYLYLVELNFLKKKKKNNVMYVLAPESLFPIHYSLKYDLEQNRIKAKENVEKATTQVPFVDDIELEEMLRDTKPAVLHENESEDDNIEIEYKEQPERKALTGAEAATVKTDTNDNERPLPIDGEHDADHSATPLAEIRDRGTGASSNGYQRNSGTKTLLMSLKRYAKHSTNLCFVRAQEMYSWHPRHFVILHTYTYTYTYIYMCMYYFELFKNFQVLDEVDKELMKTLLHGHSICPHCFRPFKHNEAQNSTDRMFRWQVLLEILSYYTFIGFIWVPMILLLWIPALLSRLWAWIDIISKPQVKSTEMLASATVQMADVDPTYKTQVHDVIQNCNAKYTEKDDEDEDDSLKPTQDKDKRAISPPTDFHNVQIQMVQILFYHFWLFFFSLINFLSLLCLYSCDGKEAMVAKVQEQLASLTRALEKINEGVDSDENETIQVTQTFLDDLNQND
ncbi:hypothetical protein RFI_22644 [Reticulomyxa filosa]|uniref:Ion transport domain-containing protein n=1 Tax=Reticulomyxa filosa TaxID=46433 RepID=X6ML32_RETFI|nr:hypothetical protein RFI_22644 [Reticulomyxa filosa]|eukprot:ETO14723.1 hypothetical protein RFI_22644 [Reticulomyxa filosa]